MSLDTTPNNLIYNPGSYSQDNLTQFIQDDTRIFSGMDITAYVSLPGFKSFRLGTLALLSISTHRDKFPVSSLSRVNAKGFTCVAGDEPVFTPSGPVPIRDIKVGDQILSYDEVKEQISYQPCLANISQGRQECFDVKLWDGSRMNLTNSHLVRTEKCWKTVAELSDKDKLAVPLDYGSQTKIDVPDYYLKFLAYALGDGVFGDHGTDGTSFKFTLGHSDERIIAEIEAECTLNNIVYRKEDNGEGCISIHLRNCEEKTWHQNRVYFPFIAWTKTLGIYGTKSHTKFIPECVMAMSDDQTRLFLSRILSTDGSIKPRRRDCLRFRYISTSKTLVYQLKTLLARVGIHSSLNCRLLDKLSKNKKRPEIRHKHDIWCLEITQEYMYRFITEIGIYNKETEYAPYIPIIAENVQYNYEDLAEYLAKEDLKLRKKFGAGFIACRTIKVNQLRKKLGIYFDKFVAAYKSSAYAPIRWVELKSKLFSRITDTYDITVQNNSNFFGQFLSHNSGHRTIGGTMVFSVLDKTVWTSLMKLMQQNRTRKFPNDLVRGHADDLPPLDITITFVNEFGHSSVTVLLGVTLLDEGETYSIDELEVRETFSYMALDRVPMQTNISTSGKPPPLATGDKILGTPGLLPTLPCASSFSPGSQAVSILGGVFSNTTITVINPPAVLSTDVNWIHLLTTNISSSQQFSYTVDSNGTNSSRVGHITACGTSLTITQDGVLDAPPCSTVVTPTSINAVSAGQSSAVTVSTLNTSPITYSTPQSWLHVTGPSTMNGVATITVDANPGCSTRSGIVYICNQSVSVVQDGASVTLGSSSYTFPKSGGSTTITALGLPASPTITSDSWITTSFSGTNVLITAATNPSCTSRTGSVIICGKTFTVNQLGSDVVVSPNPVSVDASAQSVNITLTSTASSITYSSAAPSWVTIGSGPSSANGTLVLNIATNTGIARSTTVTITADGCTTTIPVSQAAVACSVSASPTSLGSLSLGQSATFTTSGIGAGIAVTYSTTNPHFTVSGPSTGSGTVTVTYATLDNGSPGETVTIGVNAGCSGTNSSATVTVVRN